jgi:DnaJ like chaperone protein
MSIWSRISLALSALSKGDGLAAVFDHLRTPPERSVAFTIAVIALFAKMAKADGLVTKDEINAFREVFYIPESDLPQAARVFNLARQDVSGFELYAKNIGRMFGEGNPVLNDLMEGLFYIAAADGQYHPNEDQFLFEVAAQFRLKEIEFQALRARHIPQQEPDPYTVLGVSPDQDFDQIKSIWRKLVREGHPDQMIARGVPREAIKLAERRLIQINEAYDKIAKAQVA